MSIFISLGIIILSMLILASMKLNSGVFALFYHYALGKYSRNKASFLSTFYMLGSEMVSAFLFLSIFYLNYIFFFFDDNLKNNLFSLIFAGIFIALAILSLFCYFRHEPGTRLFISSKSAKALDLSARSVSTRSDAFLLGAFSGVSELFFTLPLYIVFSYEILQLNLSAISNLPIIFIFIIIPLLPLFFIRFLFSVEYNLADYMRLRFKNKNFTRLTLFICYLVIALLILCYRIKI